MEEVKTKRIWRIDCMMCRITVDLEAETVISTDGGLEFIIKPYIICGKCRSVCVVELAKKEDQDSVKVTKLSAEEGEPK